MTPSDDLYSPEFPNRRVPVDRCAYCHGKLPAEHIESHPVGAMYPRYRFCSDPHFVAWVEECERLARR